MGSKLARAKKMVYNVEYAKKNLTKIEIKLKNLEDKNLIEFIKSKPNMTSYIKKLLYKDFEEYKMDKDFEETLNIDSDYDNIEEEEYDNNEETENKEESFEINRELIERYNICLEWNSNAEKEYNRIQKIKTFAEMPSLQNIAGYKQEMEGNYLNQLENWKACRERSVKLLDDLILYRNEVEDICGDTNNSKLEEMIMAALNIYLPY